MTIEWLRDLVIIVTGTVAIAVLILAGVIAFSLYKRLRRILTSIQVASSGVEKVVTIVADGVVEPLSRLAAIIEGVYKGISSAFQVFKGGKNNE